MASYTSGFRARMIKRMTGPSAISATALSKEVGVSQATLSRWLQRASTLGRMSQDENNEDQANRTRNGRWSAQEKLRVVLEASSLSEEELGAFLRREGLHEAQLQEWRTKALEAASSALKDSHRKQSERTPEARKIRELERELSRKDKALAEVAALLALQKKVQEIWGDEDDDTRAENGR